MSNLGTENLDSETISKTASKIDAVPSAKEHFADTYTVESGIHLDEETSESAGFSGEEIYEEGKDLAQGALGFVKNNWMAILGAGAVIGVGAYVLRKGLPFALATAVKKSASRSKGKGTTAKKVAKTSRAHH